MIPKAETNKLRSQFSPDGSDLRHQQLIMLDMLIKFDKFCSNYKLNYWLSSGTLLGAIRHNGFIPWDDDMDIEMYRKDYFKLLYLTDKLKKETGIILQNYESDDEYIAPYPKLRDVHSELHEIHGNDIHYKYKGIYIDIFIRDKSSKFTSLVSHICQYLSYKITRSDNKIIRKKIKWICYKLMHNSIFPTLDYVDKIFCVANKYRYIKGSGYYDSIRHEDIFPLKYYDFEDYKFPGPIDAHKYLTTLYGNYMQLPEIDNLHPHYGTISFTIDKDNNTNDLLFK